ncbi:hypothetical protein OS493_017336 [Desmophyllum pertusum]|uniref:Uncharacterized protein n=1 Tax=Desmophyllum pertusum TaxID=174260 RepID=A0A9X0A2I4_9CNID|nr:hypothetical protein OS493_017336 [Desmophyllum pertusum]
MGRERLEIPNLTNFKMAASISLRDAKKALKKYLPYGGLAGYAVLGLHSVKVHVEELIIGRDNRPIVFHGALMLSTIGMTTYLYDRPVFNIMEPPKSKRLLWSLFGTWMFNFGSLLLWAIGKEICPENKVIRAIMALSSSAGLVYIGTDYLEAVDRLRLGIIAEREDDGPGEEGAIEL